MLGNYEQIIEKIQFSSGLSKEKIEEKVKNKLKDLQDLISKEGAAQIIANELDVRLFDATPKEAKISALMTGSSAVTLTARIIQKYELRTFNKNNHTGKILSMLIGDETGTTRLAIWDENIIAEAERAQEGDIIKVHNAYVRQNQNFKELHLGNKAQLIINPEGETIGEIKTTAVSSLRRVTLEKAKPNDFIESFATIVQIFEPRYYDACPQCNKKVLPQGIDYLCIEHGKVSPTKVPIVNVVLDDGTSALRAVCFRNTAEKVIGAKEKPYEEIKKEVLGKQVIVKAKVTKNDMFDRTELMVNMIEEADPNILLKELQESS